MKKYYWAIKHHGGIWVYSIRTTRKLCIEDHLEGYSFKDWKECKKSGYSVVKVVVIEKREEGE